MSRYRKHLLGAVCVFSVISEVQLVHGQAVSSIVPLSPGLTIVLAVHAPKPAAPGSRIAQGDYEMVVTVANVSPNGIDESTRIEAVDENRQPIQVTIRRRGLGSRSGQFTSAKLGFPDTLTIHRQVPGRTPSGRRSQSCATCA